MTAMCEEQHGERAYRGDSCVLVTGAAGFIGSYLVTEILKQNKAARVIGLDNMNDYYDVRLKEWRLRRIDELAARCEGTAYRFVKADVADREAVNRIIAEERPDIVVHLAAQAGVRYSITNPDSYIQSNLVGFFNVLEACRQSLCGHGKEGGESPDRGVRHLIYASSSSVYGNGSRVPYRVDDRTDAPVSLYAATKKADELMAYAYSHLYGLPCTGVRFFTVYGPAGRPDMAYYSIADKLARGEKYQIYNYGNQERDFTYIDDIVEGLMRIIFSHPGGAGEADMAVCGSFGEAAVLESMVEKKEPDTAQQAERQQVPYRLYNIGNSHPEKLMDFLSILEEELQRAGVLPADFDFAAHREYCPMQPGDVLRTYADVRALERDFGFRPHTSLRDGLRKFAAWYAEYTAERE